MSKKRRKYEAVSTGSVNLFEEVSGAGARRMSNQEVVQSEVEAVQPEVVEEVEMQKEEPEAVQPEVEAEQDEATPEVVQSEVKAEQPEVVEAVVVGFVPNPTIVLARTEAFGVVPVLHCHAYRYRRGMKVNIVKHFSGWEMKR